MLSSVSNIFNIFKIPDLRKKILFTLAIAAVCRVGTWVPTPGIDGLALAAKIGEIEESQGGTLLGLMNMFSGGALKQCTIFALGIMPYISASIILQLLTVVIPQLERLAREGEAGRRKINQYTRYGTLLLCVFQSFFIALALEHPERISALFRGTVIVLHPGWGFRILAVLTLTTGTVLLMWLGEQIQERGIGNGISLVITIGIISRLPTAIDMTVSLLKTGGEHKKIIFMMLLLIALGVFVIAGIIFVTQAQRKIPIQRAQQIRGRRIYTAQNTYMPLRVNYAGVIPIIFASSLLLFPATMGALFAPLSGLANILQPGSLFYQFLYVLLIIFFCYFWTATQFNPIQIAEDMKKSGAFIPGIRPGKNTAEYLERIMTRITLAGAMFLALIAVLPSLISAHLKIPYLISQFFGGTGLLIIVGVMLDTMRQVESHLLMRHYDGFMKKGRIKGRF